MGNDVGGWVCQWNKVLKGHSGGVDWGMKMELVTLTASGSADCCGVIIV